MNQLIWYGENQGPSASITSLTMQLDEFKISSASHMSLTFEPSNPYYGQQGEHKMCANSLDSKATQYCEKGGEVWCAAWGYEEENKVHARLTWNPYYKELEKSIGDITQH